MRKLKSILSILVLLLVLAYALSFAAHNSQIVTLDFLIGAPVSWPAALWLGVVLMVGTALGLFSGIIVYIRQKLRIRRLSKELQDTQKHPSKLP